MVVQWGWHYSLSRDPLTLLYHIIFLANQTKPKSGVRVPTPNRLKAAVPCLKLLKHTYIYTHIRTVCSTMYLLLGQNDAVEK